jgi:hypothetical protein
MSGPLKLFSHSLNLRVVTILPIYSKALQQLNSHAIFELLVAADRNGPVGALIFCLLHP